MTFVSDSSHAGCGASGRRRPILGQRSSDEEGFTLIELLVVLAILGVVIAASTQLLVSALRSQADQTARAEGQQDARLALVKLRREIHCGSAVSSNPTSTWPARAITIKLGNYCPTNSAGYGSVTWCTSGSGPYTLWRYPHLADLSAETYSNACTGTGQAWVRDIVNGGLVGGVIGGKIFAGYGAPTTPSMDPADLSYGAAATPGLGSSASDTTYAYVVDPVTASGEQPGTEAAVVLAAGTINKSLLLSWGTACGNYPTTPAITGFKVYGRTAGAELLLGTVASTGCGTTSFTDNGTVSPSGTSPVGTTRAKLQVDIPVRSGSSTKGVVELQDDIVLRNTPR